MIESLADVCEPIVPPDATDECWNTFTSEGHDAKRGNSRDGGKDSNTHTAATLLATNSIANRASPGKPESDVEPFPRTPREAIEVTKFQLRVGVGRD